MRRAGAVYRQMVLGIGDLMTERDRARGQYKLSRTTIGGTNNIPFKCAPTQRLAIDLLLAGSGNFQSGPAALKASVRDIKRHLIATFAGLHGSLHAAIDSFDPAALDAAVGDRAGLLKSRAACQAEEVAQRRGDLSRQLAEGDGGSLERAFVAAYAAAEAQANAEERSCTRFLQRRSSPLLPSARYRAAMSAACARSMRIAWSIVRKRVCGRSPTAWAGIAVATWPRRLWSPGCGR